MGIFDAFTKGGRKSRALQKKISTVANRRAADEDRYIAYEALAEEGTDDAIYGLLLRFTYVKDIGQRSRSTDEEDKRYVHDLVVNLGEKALAAIRRFLLAREGPVGAPKHSISWALRILDRIVPSPELHWEIVKEILDDNEPGYEKNPSRKHDLMTYLGGSDRFAAAAVAEAVRGYLEDSDEGVRFAAADTLLKQGDPSCKETLSKILADTDESLQQRSLILSGFVTNGWLEEAAEFIPNMPEPALMAAVEALERLDDGYRAQQAAEKGTDNGDEGPAGQKRDRGDAWTDRRMRVRDLMLACVEADRATEEVRSRASEFLVTSGMSVQGARGRVEKALPKGYKVRKQRVERVPEGMREPYLSLAAQGLIERVRGDRSGESPDGEAKSAEPEPDDRLRRDLEGLTKILRSTHTRGETRAQIIGYLASSGQSLKGLEKQVSRALPRGYTLDGEGRLKANYAEMDEPFLTQAADDLLDPYLSEPPDDAREAQDIIPDEIRLELIEMVCNQRTDERTVDRVLDRFAAYGWSVRDFERRLERHLPDEYRISAPKGGLAPRIFKVSIRI
jgi:hypothetical protein